MNALRSQKLDAISLPLMSWRGLDGHFLMAIVVVKIEAILERREQGMDVADDMRFTRWRAVVVQISVHFVRHLAQRMLDPASDGGERGRAVLARKLKRLMFGQKICFHDDPRSAE